MEYEMICRGSREYRIKIRRGLLADAEKEILALGRSGKTVLVTDSRLFSLYSKKLKSAFPALSPLFYVFQEGEKSKNPEEYLRLVSFLAENRLGREDRIIAFGGGVTGDLAGFAAATYLRGIEWIQIPTSLLAMIDSSVGGKTGVDLPEGKNLLGAFHQPSLVLTDPDLLDTLDEKTFSDGMAEAVKYGMISSEELFSLVENGITRENLPDLIARCVSIKVGIVAEDEKEQGIRSVLNFGHTVGHAIEKCSGYSVSHGQAVGLGMLIVSAGCAKTDASGDPVTSRLKEVLRRYALPVSCSFNAEDLFRAVLSDKKRSGDELKLIVPERIGHCVPVLMPLESFREILEKGMASV
ncbi:MAG: 3-dehydroquinate synthase [Clostridia bacterium]|nr:3-dehydroquinate synthase [Clostridia bacterium]